MVTINCQHNFMYSVSIMTFPAELAKYRVVRSHDRDLYAWNCYSTKKIMVHTLTIIKQKIIDTESYTEAGTIMVHVHQLITY